MVSSFGVLLPIFKNVFILSLFCIENQQCFLKTFMWTFIDLHLAFFLSALFVWTYLALCDWLFCATFSLLALLRWELQPRFIISILILSSSLTFPVLSRGSTYWPFRLSCPSLPLNFWPRFTFSSSVILLCFFRPGLAQFLGHTLGSLLDCHPNSLPALLHLATLQKSLSKLGLDRGSSDLSTIIMGMIFWFSSVQSCLTLCDPTDGSTPGPPVHY